VEEPEAYVSDKEIMGDDFEESNTLISPEAISVITEFIEVTSVTTEFTDVLPKNNTLIFFKLIHVITGIAEVLHEDLPDRLPPTRGIQHVIVLTPELVFPSCHTI